MTIHKTGHRFLIVIFLILLPINISIYLSFKNKHLVYQLFFVTSFIIYFIIFIFFRKPKRIATIDEKNILSPADGEIVAIEETTENEYFKQKMLKVSVFMSVWNVHINWLPVSGTIVYKKHHDGKHIAAFLPKSVTAVPPLTS